MDCVEKLQYQNYHATENEEASMIPEALRGYVWWLFPVECLEHILTMRANSIEACEELNSKI